MYIYPMVVKRQQYLGDDVGFIPLIMAGLTIATSVAQSIAAKKRQKAAAEAAQREAQAIAQAEAQARARAKAAVSGGSMDGGGGFLSGWTPLILGAAVGVPLIAFLLLKK
jgi:hypothetical protein